jgi:hypothetical protein
VDEREEGEEEGKEDDEGEEGWAEEELSDRGEEELAYAAAKGADAQEEGDARVSDEELPEEEGRRAAGIGGGAGGDEPLRE